MKYLIAKTSGFSFESSSAARAVLTLILSLTSLVGCSHFDQSLGRKNLSIDQLWARDTTKSDYMGFRRMNRATPVVTDRLVVQANAIDGITAYSRDNGDLLWSLSIRGGVEAGVTANGDRLFFGASDGMFYSVNINTGKILWSFPMRAETLSLPTVEGSNVYVLGGNDVLYCLDKESGKQIWVYNRQSSSTLSIRAGSRPTVDGESVYVGFSDGFVASLRRKDGGLNWERKLSKNLRFKDVDTTPLVINDRLFTASFDGSIFCLDKASGQVTWEVEEGAYAPLTVQDQKIYAATTGGALIALDRDSGKILWKVSSHKGITTQAALYRGYLIYGESEGGMVVLDPNTQKEMARFEPGHGLTSSPWVNEKSGEVFFVSGGANLFALRVSWKRERDLLPWEK